MLKHAKNSIFLLLVLLVGGACSRSISSEEELNAWIRSVDYEHKDTVGTERYFFEVRWLPPEFFILQEHRILNALENQSPDSSENGSYKRLLEIKKNIRANLYFQLTVKAKGNQPELHEMYAMEGANQNRAWLQKLMFGLQKEIFMVSDETDTTELSMYQMENIYGIKAAKNFLLVFPRDGNGNTDLMNSGGPLKIKIKEFGQGTGKMTFSIPWPPDYTTHFLTVDN